MADLGDKPIVIFRRDDAGYGANSFYNFLHSREGAGWCGSYRTQEIRCVMKQIGGRRFRTPLFKAGHWMAADEWNADAFRFVADRSLRAADVHYECLLTGELIEKPENVSD